jgi:hypothetical protein
MTCPTGKRCFKSVREARIVMSGFHARMRIYVCPYCRRLHTTKERKVVAGYQFKEV